MCWASEPGSPSTNSWSAWSSPWSSDWEWEGTGPWGHACRALSYHPLGREAPKRTSRRGHSPKTKCPTSSRRVCPPTLQGSHSMVFPFEFDISHSWQLSRHLSRRAWLCDLCRGIYWHSSCLYEEYWARGELIVLLQSEWRSSRFGSLSKIVFCFDARRCAGTHLHHLRTPSQCYKAQSQNF